MAIGCYILHMATKHTFTTVYKGKHTKEMLVIDETVHVAVGLQLLETSSITTPKETISIVGTRYSFQRTNFRKNMAILPICDNEKNSVW